MIHGVVNQSCEAILPIVVKNDTRTQLVDAVIDTGFSGFLALPSSTILALDLIWKGRDIATKFLLLHREYAKFLSLSTRIWVDRLKVFA
jgi:predicted aspartyl protease